MTASCSTARISNSGEKIQNLPSGLDGDWILQVESLEREPVIEMRLRFTTNAADSCIGGTWSEIEVLSELSFTKNEFQFNNDLSYHLINNTLVIGRNLLCDAYIRMKGELKGSSVSGRYYIFGHSDAEELGYFTLKTVK